MQAFWFSIFMLILLFFIVVGTALSVASFLFIAFSSYVISSIQKIRVKKDLKNEIVNM